VASKQKIDIIFNWIAKDFVNKKL